MPGGPWQLVMPISHRVGQTRSSLPRPSSFILEKPVTLRAASLVAGIWQLAAQGNMYPAWALLPREVPSAEQI
jgi:hypothetical protein